MVLVCLHHLENHVPFHNHYVQDPHHQCLLLHHLLHPCLKLEQKGFSVRCKHLYHVITFKYKILLSKSDLQSKIKDRGVGTCVRVGGQDQKWGAKDMNFKENPIFFSNFG